MPANTMNSMILGYAVILGLLVLYGISLAVRITRVKKRLNNHEE